MESTFNFNGAKITFSPELTTGDALDVTYLADLLTEGDKKRGSYYKYLTFAEFVVSVKHVDGDLGFPLPSPEAPLEELREAYAAWLQTVGFLGVWRAARRSVEKK